MSFDNVQIRDNKPINNLLTSYSYQWHFTATHVKETGSNS